MRRIPRKWRIWRKGRFDDIASLSQTFERKRGDPESGEFDENGGFGKTDDLTTFRHKNLGWRQGVKEWGTGKRQVRRKWRIWRKGRFDDSLA